MTELFLWYVVASIFLTAMCAGGDRASGGKIFESSTYRYAAFMVFAVPFFIVSLLFLCFYPIAWVVRVWIEWMVRPPEPPIEKRQIQLFEERTHDDPRTRPN